MFSKLQVALDKANAKVCAAIAKKYAAEEIYSFALYTSGEYSYVGDSFATIAGLKQVAEKYLQEKSYKKEWKTVDVAMRELKWSPCDSPYHNLFEQDFAKASELLEAIWEKVDMESEEAYMDTCRCLHAVFTEALNKVRASGVFADTVVLNVLMGDQSDEERFLNAEPLNSKTVLAAFRKELTIDAQELTQLRKNRWKVD